MLSREAELLLVMAGSLLGTFLLNLGLKRMKIPSIIAPLALGLMLNYYFAAEIEHYLSPIANLGVLVILFFIGLKVDFRFVKDFSRNSLLIASLSGLIPFVLGFIAGFIYSHNLIVSIFVGIALSITAEEVSISILDELKLLQKRLGQVIIESGIIGDIFEISAVALLGFFVKAKTDGITLLGTIFFDLALFVMLVFAIRYVLLELMFRAIGETPRSYEIFAVSLSILFLLSFVSEVLSFSYILGALMAGIMLKDKLISGKHYNFEHQVTSSLETFIFAFFEPLVFIYIGVLIRMDVLLSNLMFGGILTVLALSGKLLGAMLGDILAKGNVSEGLIIGWGLNSRGATELFTVLVAQNQGIIGKDVFSAVVFMALITTLISPVIFRNLVSGIYSEKNSNGTHKGIRDK
ncbi:MAG: cation:proton antiporter [Nanoarchaeota archaeon]|nr:cation:proton antiporter [Nanoarchaeota archaeon]